MPIYVTNKKHYVPANSIYVARPSILGNPFSIDEYGMY